MSTINTPLMNLPVPIVGQESGPLYAADVNDCFTLIDQHDHSAGAGTQITPDGINISANLPFNNNFAIQLAGAALLAQSVTPASLSTIYQSGDDLYFIDGLGNNIRITQSGGIAGSPGSITGLIAPASVTYLPVSQTFVFQSDVNIAANLDVGSILLRNLTPDSTFAYTVNPPAALAANTALTLPVIPSAPAEKIVRLDDTGLMTATLDVDNVTIQIISNELVANASILSPNREHGWVLNGPYSTLTMPQNDIDGRFVIPANIIIQSIWIWSGTGVSGTTEFDIVRYAVGNTLIGSILSTTGKITASGGATDSGAVIPPKAGFVKPVISVASIGAGEQLAFNLNTKMANANDCSIRIFYQLA